MLQKEIEKIVKAALSEDKAFNDITSNLTIPKGCQTSFKISSREDIIFCGKEIILEVFAQLKNYKKFTKSKLSLSKSASDGSLIKNNQVIISGNGDARLIFAAERVILNLIQHLSGISTITNKFIRKLNNNKIKILDTRKTLPKIRCLQKYAVKIGGGNNHRLNLSDMILIKDNHIAAAGSIKNALKLSKKSKKKIEIECDNLKQVREVVKYKPNIIMLDNMNIDQIKKSSEIIRNSSKNIKIEVSGQVNLDNIKNLSKLDIDFVSIGSLTHSVKSVDIGLDIIL